MPGLQPDLTSVMTMLHLFWPWICRLFVLAQTGHLGAMVGTSSSFASQPALSLGLAGWLGTPMQPSPTHMQLVGLAPITY